MKGVQNFFVAFALFASASILASASDPGPLQDFCVALNDIKDGGKLFRALICIDFL